jgi:hypothetical protein
VSGDINGRPHRRAGEFTSGPKLPQSPRGGSGSDAGGRKGCPPALILAAGVIYGLSELLTASGVSA